MFFSDSSEVVAFQLLSAIALVEFRILESVFIEALVAEMVAVVEADVAAAVAIAPDIPLPIPPVPIAIATAVIATPTCEVEVNPLVV
jgi:hypothetical protein